MIMEKPLKLIECPRDAMQGITEFIPTEQKIAYINQLLKCGFDTLDFGSFVSPTAIPQMRDTADVLAKLELAHTTTKLLAIIANERGAGDAVQFDEIDYLGYPFSVSETFQQRNTNASIEESLIRVEKIQNLTVKSNKKLVVYLSMAFGNPYGDIWNPEIVIRWSERLSQAFGIEILALSDTIGSADDKTIRQLFSELIPALPHVEFGAHLHTVPVNATQVVQAAYESGCRRFDGALKGFGGCPMAKDDLTGNMPTELMLNWFDQQKITTGVNENALLESLRMANVVFSSH
jgi:hydroxymethylglutaryl-CoA lyase